MSKDKNARIDRAGRGDPGSPDVESPINDDQAEIGRRIMEGEFEQYHAVNPEITAGVLDAEWQEAEDSGAETPGGHVASPDQDNVDEIGRAVGMRFQDNQELRTHDEILSRRDRRRWELDRRSADGDSL